MFDPLLAKYVIVFLFSFLFFFLFFFFSFETIKQLQSGFSTDACAVSSIRGMLDKSFIISFNKVI